MRPLSFYISPSPPPPVSKKAVFNVKKSQKPLAIKLGGGGSSKIGMKPSSGGLGPSKSKLVASVFNNDSSSGDEDDDMPQEAKMRMRNVGRQTITSSGPNSFGKTRAGFVDANKLFERQLQEAMDEVSGDK